LLPPTSDRQSGLRFQLYVERLAHHLGTDKDSVLSALPAGSPYQEQWEGDTARVSGHFRTQEEIARFLSFLHDQRKTA
jgi:hypothetical protein